MQIPCVYIPGPAPAVSVANINSHSNNMTTVYDTCYCVLLCNLAYFDNLETNEYYNFIFLGAKILWRAWGKIFRRKACGWTSCPGSGILCHWIPCIWNLLYKPEVRFRAARFSMFLRLSWFEEYCRSSKRFFSRVFQPWPMGWTFTFNRDQF